MNNAPRTFASKACAARFFGAKLKYAPLTGSNQIGNLIFHGDKK